MKIKPNLRLFDGFRCCVLLACLLPAVGGVLAGQATLPMPSDPSESTGGLPIVQQSIEVKGDVVDPSIDGSFSGVHLSSADMQNRSTSLTNDPLRSMQLLPGVVANDDMKSSFMVRGANAYRVGIYLDGILLHSPFHKTDEGPGQASLSTVPGQLLDSAVFFGGNHPIRLSDTDAGAVELQTREGNRSEKVTSVSLSMLEADVTTEGGFGPRQRGSWLLTARQSYMNYLINRISSDPMALFGYRDLAAKLNYDLSPRHNLSLLLMGGKSGLDLGNVATDSGTTATSAYRSVLASLAWRYAVNSHLMLTSRLAELGDSVRNRDSAGNPLVQERNREHVIKESATWVVNSWDTFEFGFGLRSQWTSGLTPLGPSAAGTQSSGYLRNALVLLGGRVMLDVGARWDAHSMGEHPISSVNGGAGIRVWRSGTLHAGWAQYVQFADLDKVMAYALSSPIRPERASHLDVGLEQKLGTRTRLGLDFYRRNDRDLLPEQYRPNWLPPALDTMFRLDGVRGKARGAEVSFGTGIGKLSFMSAYALGFSQIRPNGIAVTMPSDADQRHTLSTYMSYELRPNLRISAKFRYGSGLPVPGPFQRRGGEVFTTDAWNELRMDSYSRLDVRVDRSWRVGKAEFTLHGEVLNMLNESNLQFAGAAYQDQQTGRVMLNFGRMLPVLPTAGLSFRY
jgi:hypothetical protein